MNIHHSFETFNTIQNPVATIGFFDGVHKGHQQVIAYLNEQARKINGESVLITFDPHPKIVLSPTNHKVQLILSQEEKIEKLKQYDVQHVVILKFTHQLSQLSAHDFLTTILIEQLKIKHFVIGYDHRFGRNREGDINFLRKKASELQFSVAEIPAQTIDNITISSTKIRKALQEGKIEIANDFLGTPFSMKGTVVKGQQLGRTLGFPTANIRLQEALKIIPKDGIYIVKVFVDTDVQKTGILSIGNNPTINADTQQTIEVFLLDFSGDLYETTIVLEFMHFIRPTEKFGSIEQLIEQMKQDETYTRNYMYNLVVD